MIDPDDYTWLRIEPVDAWFFRDGRPSNRGEDQSDLKSEFPPNANTVVGALRAAFARSQGWNGRGSWADDLKPLLGDGPDDVGQLSFLGPLLVQGDELLWPMPRHVAGHMVEERFQPTVLLVPSSEPIATDMGHVHLPMLPVDWQQRQSHVAGLTDQQRSQPPEPRRDLWVTSRGMSKILSEQLPDPDECRPGNTLFAYESRIGIHRPDRQRESVNGSDEGEASPSMYSPRYVRLQNGVALTMAIRGLPEGWSVPTLFPLGGESRLAAVETLNHKPAFPTASKPTDRSIVVSVTPTRFGDPWWGAGPGDDAAKLSPELSGSIVTTALDRPLSVGGWDSVKGQPRPLVPFAPPGTVWWCNADPSSVSGLLQLGDNQQARSGNGLAFVVGPS